MIRRFRSLQNSIRNSYDTVLKREYRLISVLVLAFFLIGFIAGWHGRVNWTAEKDAGPVKETRLAGFDFINPLLECDSAKESLGRQLLPFHYRVSALIEEKKKLNWATHVSVYFRDLNNGLGFSIHDQEKFSPASMLKVPLLIAYLKWAEMNPELLAKR